MEGFNNLMKNLLLNENFKFLLLSIGSILILVYHTIITLILLPEKKKRGLSWFDWKDDVKIYKELMKTENLNKRKIYRFIWTSYLCIILFLLLSVILYNLNLVFG
jgi:hypothetical protein